VAWNRIKSALVGIACWAFLALIFWGGWQAFETLRS